jgi:TonB family protein
MLTLSKRGAVRDATVLKGPTTLREAAIEAARKHNYKHQMDVWPFQGQITVGVIFPQDNRSSPEIRQALPAGVPSCVYATAIRVAPEVMQSRLLRRVEPVFPTEVQPVEGTVILRVRVDKDGNVFKAEKISGPDALAAPVIDAVKGWKYEPTLINGSPIEVETTVELKLPR